MRSNKKLISDVGATVTSLFLAYFMFAVLLNSVGTVILQVQNSFGVTEGQASVLEAFKDLPIAITSFLVASLLARIGYRRATAISLYALALTCLAVPFVPSFWMIKLLFVATGIGFALTKVSAFAAIGLIAEDSARHKAIMNYLESFFMVGITAGYFIFGAAIDDVDPTSLSWLNVYYVLALMAGVAALIMTFVRLDESGSTQADSTALEEFGEMLRLAIKPLVLVFVLSAFLYVLVEQSVMTWLPTFNSKILKLAPSLSVEMASILAISTAIGRFSAGYLVARVNWLLVLLVGLGAAAAVILMTLPMTGEAATQQVTRWSQAPLAAFVFPLVGLFIAPIYPTINSVILSSLPTYRHGAMAGLIVVFSALGGTSGSIITGHMFEAFGGRSAFYLSLLPIGFLAGLLIIFSRMVRRA